MKLPSPSLGGLQNFDVCQIYCQAIRKIYSDLLRLLAGVQVTEDTAAICSGIGVRPQCIVCVGGEKCSCSIMEAKELRSLLYLRLVLAAQ